MKNNRLAIITGATRGIGRAIAQEFLELGYELILTGTNQQQIDILNRDADDRVTYVAVDFSDNKSSKGFFEYIATIKKIDVCINCAGINIIKAIDCVSDEELEHIVAVNYTSIYRTCREVSKIMKLQGGGNILNIASIWSVVSKERRTLYSGTKTALLGLTRALAAELGPDKVLVNSLSPGFVMTDLTRSSLSEDELSEIETHIPLNRCAQPIEIAKAAAFLAGTENTYLTGQNIIVDGGFSIV